VGREWGRFLRYKYMPHKGEKVVVRALCILEMYDTLRSKSSLGIEYRSLL
jgi:hypothetical protein